MEEALAEEGKQIVERWKIGGWEKLLEKQHIKEMSFRMLEHISYQESRTNTRRMIFGVYFNAMER